MRIHAKRNSLGALLFLCGLNLLSAQQANAPATPAPSAVAGQPGLPALVQPTIQSQVNSAPAAAVTPPAVPGPVGAAAPTDSAASALDYLFNRKPQDGTTAQAVS